MTTTYNNRRRSKTTLLKVVILGDGGIGKSQLMNRFVNNQFDSQSFHTIGVEFLNKELFVDGEHFTLQIWDTAGQERFRSLRTPFYRGADCCMLTFALNDAESLHNLSMWRKEFIHYADIGSEEGEGGGDTFPFLLVGNKCDLLEEGEAGSRVTERDVEDWFEQLGRTLPYVRTSAKDATNVETAFRALVKETIKVNLAAEHPSRVDLVDLRHPVGANTGPGFTCAGCRS